MKTLRAGFAQPHFFSSKKKSGAGFTLIELLITIAISGIITAIVFTGLRSEQQRSAAKDAADRIQVELQGLQNKMQSAISLPTKYCTRGGVSYSFQGKTCTVDVDNDSVPPDNGCGTDPDEAFGPNIQGRCVEGPPSGYGLTISDDATAYTIFADMPTGTTPADGKSGGVNDQIIGLNKPFGTNIQAVTLQVNGTVGAVGQLDISFSGANGGVIITQTGGFPACTSTCTSARIVLKNTINNVCYAVTIEKASGIVSKRQSVICPS